MIEGQLGFDLDELLPSTGAQPRPALPSWWGFSLDESDEAARLAYVKRFGQQPAELRRVPGCLLAGPLLDM